MSDLPLEHVDRSKGCPHPILLWCSTSDWGPSPTLRTAGWRARLIGSIASLEGSQEGIELEVDRRQLNGER
jgi:hypothetical protein